MAVPTIHTITAYSAVEIQDICMDLEVNVLRALWGGIGKMLGLHLMVLGVVREKNAHVKACLFPQSEYLKIVEVGKTAIWGQGLQLSLHFGLESRTVFLPLVLGRKPMFS